MNRQIRLTVNGKKKEIRIDVRQSLLEVLREQLGLLSVKQGCSVGECGACTVLIDDVPIDACLYLAVWADGKTIRTVEGESRDGKLSSVQQAFVDEGAVQCGICTPGMIMTAKALIDEKGASLTDDDIAVALKDTFCRCTGYQSVARAIRQAAGANATKVAEVGEEILEKTPAGDFAKWIGYYTFYQRYRNRQYADQGKIKHFNRHPTNLGEFFIV